MHTNTVHICTSIHPALQLLLICSSPWRGPAKYEGNAPYFGKADQQYNSHWGDIMMGADGGGINKQELLPWNPDARICCLLQIIFQISTLQFSFDKKKQIHSSRKHRRKIKILMQNLISACAPTLFPNWATLQALWHERLHFAIVWSYPKYTKGSNCEMANRKIDSHPFFVSLAIQHQTSCCNYNSYYPHPHHGNDHPPHDHRPHLGISLEFPWVRDASLVAGVGKTRVYKVELVRRAERRQFHHLRTTYSGWAIP